MSVSAPVAPLASLEELILKAQSAIYVHVTPLKIDSWRTPEPVPFAARETGERGSPVVGEPWGRRLFDCAWMRFSTTIPADAVGQPLVSRIDINGELCVVDAEGVPVRGLTNVKSTFDERLGGPAKTVYQLPASAISGDQVEFWADCAFNDLFGFLKDDGRIALAEIAIRREDVRQLYYDLETLRDFVLELPETDERRLSILAATASLADTLDTSDAASIAQARARLRPWFESDAKDRLRVHAIGHAHLDLAWLWPIRETIRKGARTFASALYNIERYPEYIFGCSQPQLFAWMREHYPALYVKIKAAVLAGRIEPQGTFWVEPDCNMPSGESFVRQILLGARFFRKEFGIVPDYCWEPDVFGYNGQLPQILKKSGHRYFMTQKLSWNVVNRFGHQSFHWEGIDGTRLLTHMLPEETYNSPAAARSLQKIATNYFERDVSDHALMVFGIGDGGGGPDAEHLERLRRAPGLPGLPTVKIEPASAFFETWSRDAEKFPVWKGELYLERHQGTLTTQALVKRNNRRCEVALRELEWAAFIANTQTGVPYPAEALDRLWKEVLLYQFHDVLPGSSIKRVYDECNARYALILAELDQLARERYTAVASHAVAGARAGDTVVFNSLAWPRVEWFKSASGDWHRLDIPALGHVVLPPSAVAFSSAHLVATDRLLENENLRATFSEEGRLISLFDKRAAREVLAAGEIGNDLVVIADTGDAWDLETDHGKKEVRGYLRQPVRRPRLHETSARIDGPSAELLQVWRIGNSEIHQRLRLLAGSESLVFETKVDWQEPAHMLRVRFPVAIMSDEARFEIPFGSIRRSTLDDTTHRQAQVEVAALQWVDLSQADYGVTLLNDCKHGFRVKNHVIDMNLIRSVPHPGSALIGKDDQPDTSTAAVYGDLGSHTFSYALQPHAGPADLARITAAARAFNIPISVVVASTRSNSLPASTAQTSAVATALPFDPSIEIAAFKQADDGNGWIARLVNVSNHAVIARSSSDTSASANLSARTWSECDLMERAIPSAKADSSTSHSRAELSFQPFEIKTLRLG